MKRFITWSLPAAVLIGLAAGIYFLTLSSLALAEEKGLAAVAAEAPTGCSGSCDCCSAGSGTEAGPDRGEYRGCSGCYRRFRGCSDQGGPGKVLQK